MGLKESKGVSKDLQDDVEQMVTARHRDGDNGVGTAAQLSTGGYSDTEGREGFLLAIVLQRMETGWDSQPDGPSQSTVVSRPKEIGLGDSMGEKAGMHLSGARSKAGGTPKAGN